MEAAQEWGRGATDRALEAACAIYARWEAEEQRSPLDRVVEAEFRSRRYLNSRERRWVAEVVYNTVRFRRRQIRLLEILGLPLTPATLLRLTSIAPGSPTGEPRLIHPPFQRTPPLAAREALEAALANLPGPAAAHDFLRTTLSFPDEMAEALEDLLDAEAIPAAVALNIQAPTTLRVNTLRITRAQVQAALPDTTPTRYSPWGLELPNRANLYDLPGFRDGWYELQEEASQLAVLLTDAQPGQTVVEIGAGAGGKTLALAALMENRGRLIALDTSQRRLEELHKRAKRAGVTCVETHLLSIASETGSASPSRVSETVFLEQQQGVAQHVFCDVPCTGSGVLRRSPAAKWRSVDLSAVVALQQDLLVQASAYVARGGHLYYVTCAFERAQNEAVIDTFLASPVGSAFHLEPVDPRLRHACRRAATLTPPARRFRKSSGRAAAARSQEAGTPGVQSATPKHADEEKPNLDALTDKPYLRTWPHRHRMDAFFAACLRRR